MKEIQDIDLKALIEAETGQRFNKDKKICSPFTNEDTPSFSIFFNSNANKWQYKDFSNSGKYGDALDFVMEYKNMDYNQAREYLGLEVTKSPIEEFENIIRDYVSKQVRSGNKQGYKPLGIFTFVDENNNPIYAKVKFLKPDGKKETPYYSLQDGQVYNKRLHDEVPYNYYNLLQGIANNKTIVFLEGEKDVNTINNTLSKKDYVATSIKGFKDFEKIKGEFMKIAVIGDTGIAGLKYIDNIKFNFLKDSSSFKIINLPGIKSLGDNKDVTDWLEAGHTKAELLKAFDRSLDLKNKRELQQDKRGIYITKFNKAPEDADEDVKTTREYLTDFIILEASKVNKVDAEVQGIRLKIKSCIDGKEAEKIGSSRIFDDVRAFRNFLGMDFSFTGKNINDLVKLKTWINWYWAIDNKEIYTGAKFLPLENGKFQLITSTGALKNDIKDYSVIADNTKIDLMEVEEITKDELQELMQYLFKFLDFGKALSIIGSALSFLEVAQNIEAGEKLHHLLIVGESESGKSTILEKVIAPLLNYPIEEKKAISTTTFATQKLLSIGNYPIIFDEFKPSMMDIKKIQKLSDILRNVYDRTTINRGDKSFELKDFKLTRPVIIAGEESYYNGEKALVTRSCIVYISKNERTEESNNAIHYLMDHEQLLKKLGKSLILEALNMPVEEYKDLRIKLRGMFTLKDRPLNTAINISCGIELLNKVLVKHGLQPVEEYYNFVQENIREEILEGGEDTKSVIERMIILYNELLQDNNYLVAKHAIKAEKGKTYIRSQILVDTLHRYSKDYQSIDIPLLKLKDFRTQAKKAGYIIKMSAKQFRDKETSTNPWYDEYNTRKLSDLEVGEIVECDLMEEAVTMAEQKIFNIAK